MPHLSTIQAAALVGPLPELLPVCMQWQGRIQQLRFDCFCVFTFLQGTGVHARWWWADRQAGSISTHRMLWPMTSSSGACATSSYR